eukprot:569082-Rhodomonas_salina.2
MRGRLAAPAPLARCASLALHLSRSVLLYAHGRRLPLLLSSSPPLLLSSSATPPLLTSTPPHFLKLIDITLASCALMRRARGVRDQASKSLSESETSTASSCPSCPLPPPSLHFTAPPRVELSGLCAPRVGLAPPRIALPPPRFLGAPPLACSSSSWSRPRRPPKLTLPRELFSPARPDPTPPPSCFPTPPTRHTYVCVRARSMCVTAWGCAVGGSAGTLPTEAAEAQDCERRSSCAQRT